MEKQTHTGSELRKTQRICNQMMNDQLGCVLRPEDMAHYLGLDVKTVRTYYSSLGGIRLGRRILFFEKEVINAVQKRSKMGCPSENEREEERENLPEQEGCSGMGKQESIKSREDMVGEDKHGLLN
jgi:hypothetical protein